MIPGGYDRTRDGLAEGCCSAISPCSHQRREPETLCAFCQDVLGDRSGAAVETRQGLDPKDESPAPRSEATPKDHPRVGEELRGLSEKATQGEWSIWREKISDPQEAVNELEYQVRSTEPVGDALYLLSAGGKCPATTGCGPCSEANAAFIVALVNAYRSGSLLPQNPTPPGGGAGWRTTWTAWSEDDCDSDPAHDLDARLTKEWFVGQWHPDDPEPVARVYTGGGANGEHLAHSMARQLNKLAAAPEPPSRTETGERS